tara:strand:+ start:11339 stop:11560 length:222 start_codon:yes stop_codon:yes gene_type:complete
MANCKHKYVYSRSDSYWKYDGRNSRLYYHSDYYYCEKCLEEKVVEKRHFCFDSEVWNMPEWAKLITKKISGHE